LIDSDIIVASPLGLRLITGQDGEQENRREYDFLSSVQIVILDQAENFLYQNMDHLEEVLKSINKVPKTLDILNDINRIQDIYLEKLFKNFRQSIAIHNFRSIDLDYIYKQSCNSNYAGIIEIAKSYDRNLIKEYSTAYNTKITLRKLNTDSLEMVDDVRYQFFTKKLWKKLDENLSPYTILFCSSYFEFVRLRSFLKEKSNEVAYISEYSTQAEVQRNRAHYESGRRKYLLVTERVLFFSIANLRFLRNIIFYSLPESPKIFTLLMDLSSPRGGEFILKLRKSQHKRRGEETDEKEEKRLVEGEKVLFGLFSGSDKAKMERLVGTREVGRVIGGSKETFQFL
jgi:U3 small nucleolar RNA-associated protein 25